MITQHPRAKTNHYLRKLIKESRESVRSLAVRFHLNPKTVQKWKKRKDLRDKPFGAKTHHCVLSPLEQRIVVKVRKHLKLDLDDLVLTLKPYFPKLNHDNCYRILVHHKLNRLPEAFWGKGKGKFGYYLPGFLHLDLGYLPRLKSCAHRRYFLAAIDRVTKLCLVGMVMGKTQVQAAAFLTRIMKFYPYRPHHLLTDNGTEFGRKFSSECERFGIKHRQTKIKHPWTNGQAEVTIKMIKKETVKSFYYRNYRELERDLQRWQTEYNQGRKLKSLKSLTPNQKVVEYYQSLTEDKRKERFVRSPVV